MNELIKIFIQEAIATIEGLTGTTPNISNIKTDASSAMSLPIPYAITYINTSGDLITSVAVVMPVELATALADLMIGGEGESKNDMNNDDLDATKEINSNIFGALTTALGSQKNLPKLSFTPKEIQFVTQPIDLSIYQKQYDFSFSLNSIKSDFVLLITNDFADAFEKNMFEVPKNTVTLEDDNDVNLNNDEIRNISMLLDVKLNIKVRIGQKKMLLKDVISMDIGSVVELNQLANEPLEILVDDKVIAKGEVVIVDGNFGVQITDIGTKKERLEKLRG